MTSSTTKTTAAASTTVATQRRETYKAELRASILTAARAIFVHEGYASFSLRRLAAHIGYSPAAIYKHFKSKAEIFDCLAEESFAVLSRASASVKTIAGEDPVDRLRRGLWAYVKFGLENPDHYRFAFILSPPEAAPPKPRAAYSGLRERVQACIEAGQFYEGDTELIAQSLWAAAHGVTSLLVQKPFFPWVGKRRLIARVIDSSIFGLLSEKR